MNNLINTKAMLAKARQEKYAIPSFNVNNLEWAEAILSTSQELRSPAILGITSGAAKYMGGFNTVVAIIKGLIKDKNYNIPIAIHLDHGDSFETCKAAIDAGFTSVMIDASHQTIDNNISTVKRVVEYAKKFNVSVEAEIGRVGGEEDDVIAETMYADVAECIRMVKETGIDSLAPALGSVHGPYKGEPKLGFDKMKEIQEQTNLPLVLHGGSGIDDEKIKRAIFLGTCKINVNTELQQAWTAIVRELLLNDRKVYDPRKIIGPGKKGISQVVTEKITLANSINKA